MKLQHLSAVALAVSTALTLTACGGSEEKTALGLVNASNPLVQPSNTGNSNTSNADAADAIDNTGAGTNTSTDVVANPTAPNTTGNSTGTSQNRAITVETGTLTVASSFGTGIRLSTEAQGLVVVPEGISLFADKTRNSIINELKTAYDTKDAYGNSRFETVANYQATMNGINKRRYNAYQPNELGNDYQDWRLTETAKTNIDGKEYTGTREARVQLYQGAHSMVLGSQTLSGQISDGTTTKTITQGDIVIDHLKGNPTPYGELETLTNTFTYNGKAFSQAGDGNFEYTIDFIDESGHGKITGLSDKGTINLNQASIGKVVHTNYDSGQPPLTGFGIQGLAHFENGAKDGVYTLGIFGPNAAEVAGFVTEDGDKHTVGFGGKR